MGAFQQMLLASGGVLDTQTVTTGSSGVAFNRIRGYTLSTSLGSISTGNSSLYGGAAISTIRWEEGGGGGGEAVVFTVTGNFTNSGWSTMTVGSTSYSRASASFSTGGGSTSWSFFAAAAFATQPFVGTVAVTFT